LEAASISSTPASTKEVQKMSNSKDWLKRQSPQQLVDSYRLLSYLPHSQRGKHYKRMRKEIILRAKRLVEFMDNVDGS
jgi:hypothetical protein